MRTLTHVMAPSGASSPFGTGIGERAEQHWHGGDPRELGRDDRSSRETVGRQHRQLMWASRATRWQRLLSVVRQPGRAYSLDRGDGGDARERGHCTLTHL